MSVLCCFLVTFSFFFYSFPSSKRNSIESHIIFFMYYSTLTETWMAVKWFSI